MSFSIRSVVRIAAVAVAAVIVGNILWWMTGGGTDLLNIVNIDSENAPIPTGREFNVSEQPTQVRTPVPTPSMTRLVRDTPTATPPNPKEQSATDGKLIIGTINSVLEVDRYVFSGDADDRVLVRLVRTSGDLSPQFRVYHPDGTSLCSSLVTNSALVERECGLAVSGTYSILVSDQVGTQTGDYTLTINYLNHPSAVFVDLGKPVIGDIASGTEMDQLSFEGQEGSGVFVRIKSTILDT